MGLSTGITWTDATWNPWQGCTKVSPACTHCYMFRDMARYGRDGSVVVRSKPATFNLPLKRRHNTREYAIPPGAKVFTCSWSDWFHENADAWRDDGWDVMRKRPDVIFQAVTKRAERIADHLPADWGNGWLNVWMIVTVENQEWADRRIPQLLSVPAAVRGLSVEPLLGPLDLSPYLSQIDWVIVGGESGSGARPMKPLWAQTIRNQCIDAGVPFFFKQWGDWIPLNGEMVKARHNDIGNNVIDGRTWEEFPAVIGASLGEVR